MRNLQARPQVAGGLEEAGVRWEGRRGQGRGGNRGITRGLKRRRRDWPPRKQAQLLRNLQKWVVFAEERGTAALAWEV